MATIRRVKVEALIGVIKNYGLDRDRYFLTMVLIEIVQSVGQSYFIFFKYAHFNC